MLIFAVDDEPKALRVLSRAITEAAPEAAVAEFDRAGDVIAAVEGGATPDVLFSDADMPGMNGVELARALKIRCPGLNVIFATGYDDYMRDAFSLRVSGYMKKPITAEDVRVYAAVTTELVGEAAKRHRCGARSRHQDRSCPYPHVPPLPAGGGRAHFPRQEGRRRYRPEHLPRLELRPSVPGGPRRHRL